MPLATSSRLRLDRMQIPRPRQNVADRTSWPAVRECCYGHNHRSRVTSRPIQALLIRPLCVDYQIVMALLQLLAEYAELLTHLSKMDACASDVWLPE